MGTRDGLFCQCGRDRSMGGYSREILSRAKFQGRGLLSGLAIVGCVPFLLFFAPGTWTTIRRRLWGRRHSEDRQFLAMIDVRSIQHRDNGSVNPICSNSSAIFLGSTNITPVNQKMAPYSSDDGDSALSNPELTRKRAGPD